ncbi:HAD family hydrolase [uncultured Clostridium sp.]|uniref:HAD family hydrolase n=1 Tax=uncultured Clostridium sp. TaxID=59620 RepID=UPI0025D8F611|nr:HAD hydrolase-like protein [uncultured Clostridium sp.]
MMKKIVFDFDGTLLDSRRRHVVVLRDCLRSLGIVNMDLNEYLTYKADGNSTYSFLCKKLLLPEELSEKISKRWVSIIEQDEYLKQDILYEDSADTLKDCAKMAELYLLSARSNEEALHRQVESHYLKKYFQKVICVSPMKAVAGKLEALRMIQPCLIVGDTEVEYQVAEKMKIPYYLVHRGFRSEKYFSQRKIRSYENLNQLKKMLEL